MRKGFTTILLLLIFCSENFAQTKIIDSLIDWTRRHPKIDSVYITNLHRISYRLSEKDVKKSFAYYEKVVALSDSMNFVYGKSLAQINLGILLNSSANFDASNNAYYKAIDYAEACGALRLKAVSLNNIGDNLKVLQDLQKCREYTNEAILINTQLKAWRGVAINYELLQQCDLEEKNFQAAHEHLLKGMTFATRSGESYILSQFYLGFGKIHAHENNLDSANYFFEKALNEAKLQGDLRNEFHVYVSKARYLGDMPISQKISLLHTALAIAKQTGYLEGTSNAARELSNVYDLKSNKDSSLHFYRVYRSAADSLFSENNKRNVIIRESEWLIRRKEIENEHLRELSLLQDKRIKTKNELLGAVLICLLLTIAIAGIIYRTNKSKKERSESELQQKITEIQMQVLRAQMNPHFIFNSLNSIENFMMQNEKRLASDYLNKFTRLIRTILDSSLNQLIPLVKDMEALQLYIDLQQLRFNDKFKYQSVVDPQLQNGDYKVPSLIIQPYVENAIEHGIAHCENVEPEIKVSAQLKNDHILYVVEDNGIGRHQAALYNAQNKKQHKSVGMTITENRIKIFNGTASTDDDVQIEDLYDTDKQPIGTRVSVKIKIL
ncbi:MAG: histidine kinase [Ferruginibacter sp.]|nr:histidine kinase [Ferruginibacter sp.]